MNDFYVYGHFKPNEDTPFYIGKGKGKRAWRKSRRSEYWNNVVNKYGYEVRLLVENLTEEDAYEKEKELIAEVGLDNLTNILEGGEGSSSEDAQKRAQDPEWRRKNKEASQKRAQDPEWRRKNKEASQKLAQDPEWRRKMKEIGQKLAQNPEYRRKHKKAMQKLAQDPEWRRKVKEGCQKRSQNPEYRRKLKKAAQKRVQDPEYRRKIKEGKLRYHAEKKRKAAESQLDLFDTVV